MPMQFLAQQGAEDEERAKANGPTRWFRAGIRAAKQGPKCPFCAPILRLGKAMLDPVVGGIPAKPWIGLRCALMRCPAALGEPPQVAVAVWGAVAGSEPRRTADTPWGLAP